MKLLPHVTRTIQLSSVLMAVIVGSLCFSVGEGLRLTPFPVSDQLQPDGLSVARNAGDLTRSTYGPLDVPSKVQKRSKRQSTDFGPQPVAETNQDVALISHSFEDKSVQLIPSWFVSRPSGRGPPLVLS
jgi:hypothetical protein